MGWSKLGHFPFVNIHFVQKCKENHQKFVIISIHGVLSGNYHSFIFFSRLMTRQNHPGYYYCYATILLCNYVTMLLCYCLSACLFHDTVVLCVVLREVLSPVVQCERLLVVVVEPLLVLLPVSVAGVELVRVGAALLEALLHHLQTHQWLH